jgi:hypothetical protein
MSVRPVEFRCLDFTPRREGNTILIAAHLDEGQTIHLRCDEMISLLLNERLEKANAEPRTPAVASLSNLSQLANSAP